ncbi:MAG: hypothetical protein ACI9S8_003190 [Chlamydiales bacterium]|jgi:hypothetical protein
MPSIERLVPFSEAICTEINSLPIDILVYV